MSRSEAKPGGKAGNKKWGKSTICQLPRIKLTNLSARGLGKLGFGDIVTDVLRPGVADGCLLNVQPFFH